MMYSRGRWSFCAAIAALTVGLFACGRDISAPRDGLATQSATPPASAGQPRADAVGLSVTPSALVLHVGETGQLTAALVDGQGAVVSVPSGALPWTSSNGAVVTVSESGVVSAVAVGEASVSITAGGFSGSARVVVMR